MEEPLNLLWKMKIKDNKIIDHKIKILNTLKAGDILIFMPKPTTGKYVDIDPACCHTVRLTKVTPKFDKLTNTYLAEIIWDQEDALPFTLCLNDKEGKSVSIAHGNVALVDHGYTIYKRKWCKIFRQKENTVLS